MIKLNGKDWAQWDNQIGTFRAEVGGKILGLSTGDIPTALELAKSLEPEYFLTEEQIADLEAEKGARE